MLDRSHLCRFGQEVIQMAPPTCWIVSGADAKGGRVIQNCLNPLAHTVGGFGFFRPDRCQRADDVSGFNLANLYLPDLWKYVGFECRRPLRGVLCILPTRPLAFDQVQSRFLEGFGFVCCFLAIGSSPSTMSRRASVARSRAIARVTSGYGPKPRSRRRPCT